MKFVTFRINNDLQSPRRLGILENDPGFCQAVDVWGFGDAMAIDAEELRRHLICNNEQDIGFR